MPIYEYECQNCGHVFEEITIRHQSFDRLVCRRCKGYGKRIISQNSFQLKGWAGAITEPLRNNSPLHNSTCAHL